MKVIALPSSTGVNHLGCGPRAMLSTWGLSVSKLLGKGPYRASGNQHERLRILVIAAEELGELTILKHRFTISISLKMEIKIICFKCSHLIYFLQRILYTSFFAGKRPQICPYLLRVTKFLLLSRTYLKSIQNYTFQYFFPSFLQ